MRGFCIGVIVSWRFLHHQRLVRSVILAKIHLTRTALGVTNAALHLLQSCQCVKTKLQYSLHDQMGGLTPPIFFGRLFFFASSNILGD